MERFIDYTDSELALSAVAGLWRLCGSLLLAQSCFMLRSSGVGQSVLLKDVSAFPQRRCRAESVHCPRGPRAPPLHCFLLLLPFSFPHPFPSLLALSFLEGAVLGRCHQYARGLSERPHLPASQLQSRFSKSYGYIAQLSLPYQ